VEGDLWFYMAGAIGALLALVGYMQYREAQLNRQYQ